MLQAYIGAGDRNPPLHQDGEHFYIIHPDGKESWLSNTMEGQQFWFKCSCGQEHYRYCTPKNIDKQTKLLCQYCDHTLEGWRESKKAAVPACEVQAMQCMKAAGLDKVVGCQVRLRFWQGCLDFVHLPTMTVFQIDGTSHFEGVHASSTQDQLVVDIKCCKQAWKHGMRLVRIHHTCRDMPQVIRAGLELQARSFVMLTVHYNNVEVINKGQQQPYVDWVARRLSPAKRYTHTQLHCTVYM